MVSTALRAGLDRRVAYLLGKSFHGTAPIKSLGHSATRPGTLGLRSMGTPGELEHADLLLLSISHDERGP